jgi:hypothetical protein
MYVARKLAQDVTRLAVIQEDFGVGANGGEVVPAWRVLKVLHELGVGLDDLILILTGLIHPCHSCDACLVVLEWRS